MRPDTVCDLTYNRPGWTGEVLRGWEQTFYTYTDFSGFLAQLTPRIPWEPYEYARIAAECFQDLATLGVIYAEVSFGVPVRAVEDDHRFWPIVEALEAERRRAEATLPIRIALIAGLQRSLPVEVAMRSVELTIQAREKGIAIVAIDLHGDEINFPPLPFAPAFRLAETAGLGLRAHAGEASGTESVWDAIDVLGVRRIAHGMRAVEDTALLRRLQLGDITLELCPTSNVRTGLVPDLHSHPFRALFDLGIPVTVNSDDPLPFFTNIEREYRLLVDEFGFTRQEIKAVTLNAARAAFQPESERAALMRRIVTAFDAGDQTHPEPSPVP